MKNRFQICSATIAAVASLALSILCFVTDRFISNDLAGPLYDIFKGINLFTRSGALIALAGAVLEYQLTLSTYLSNVYTPDTTISMGRLAESSNLSSSMLWLRWFAHINVAVGTLIWGYGDFAFLDWGKAIACFKQAAC